MIDPTEKQFAEFRAAHKELRFWQALRAYTGADYIKLEKDGAAHDTFYYQSIPKDGDTL